MSLTKHPEGSFKELLAIALPLMLSSFSVMAMLFVDRIFLAHYSLDVLNAAVHASTFVWSFQYGWIVMGSISEVFVAQYYGSKQYNKIGEPVWQMIWLSIASIALFLPLALWGGDWFYGDDPQKYLQKDYFSLTMYFGPMFPLCSALIGFFVGRGKTLLVTALAIGSNLINAFLDWILIFGVEGILDPMGIRGTVIATNATSTLQALIFLSVFLSKDSRAQFNTGHWRIQWKAMWKCIVIGAPGAFFVAIEILGWASYYAIMEQASVYHITVAAICQSLVILLWFSIESVNKAVTTIAGNLLGANKPHIVPAVMRAGFKFHACFFGILALLFPFFSGLLIEQFLPNVQVDMLESLTSILSIALLLSLGYSFLEGIRFSISGVLTAAGDTLFLLIGGTMMIWVLMVFPMYAAMLHFKAPVLVANIICFCYSFIASYIYYLRFAAGYWKKNKVQSAAS